MKRIIFPDWFPAFAATSVWLLVLGGGCAWVLIGALKQWGVVDKLSAEDVAAWVQAVGSVAAILAAVGIASSERSAQAKLQRQDLNRSELISANLVRSLVNELDDFVRDLVDEIDAMRTWEKRESIGNLRTFQQRLFALHADQLARSLLITRANVLVGEVIRALAGRMPRDDYLASLLLMSNELNRDAGFAYIDAYSANRS